MTDQPKAPEPLRSAFLVAERALAEAKARYKFATHQDACAALSVISRLVDDLLCLTYFHEQDVEAEEGVYSKDQMRLDVGRVFSIHVRAVERVILLSFTYYVSQSDGSEESIDTATSVCPDLAAVAKGLGQMFAMYAKETP